MASRRNCLPLWNGGAMANKKFMTMQPPGHKQSLLLFCSARAAWFTMHRPCRASEIDLAFSSGLFWARLRRGESFGLDDMHREALIVSIVEPNLPYDNIGLHVRIWEGPRTPRTQDPPAGRGTERRGLARGAE